MTTAHGSCDPQISKPLPNLIPLGDAGADGAGAQLRAGPVDLALNGFELSRMRIAGRDVRGHRERAPLRTHGFVAGFLWLEGFGHRAGGPVGLCIPVRQFMFGECRFVSSLAGNG